MTSAPGCGSRFFSFLGFSKGIGGNMRRALTTAIGCGAIVWLSGCAMTPTYENATHFTTVVIDPGHGGQDSGAISRTWDDSRTSSRKSRTASKTSKGAKNSKNSKTAKNSKATKTPKKPVVVQVRKVPSVHILEKDCALDVALRLQKKLRDAGLRVVMTRHNDTFIPLDDRADISNAQHKSIFVSIHFNDSGRRDIHGMETYQNGHGTDELAHRLELAVSACPYGVYRGVMHANYRVLRKSRGPAVLVECGYLSNPEEALRCASPAYREQLASALARAIIEQRRGNE